jgi:membrane protein required for beta-lactamase induction
LGIEKFFARERTMIFWFLLIGTAAVVAFALWSYENHRRRSHRMGTDAR